MQVIVAVLVATQAVSLAAIAVLFTRSATTDGSFVPEKARETDAWNELPIEEKVRRSSAVVVVTFTVDGPKLKATTTEVIVRDPTAKVYYLPGEEARSLSRITQDKADWRRHGRAPDRLPGVDPGIVFVSRWSGRQLG